MSQLVKLKQSRARVKGFLTRTANSITEATTAAEAKVKLEKIRESWKNFEDIQQEIEEYTPEDESAIPAFDLECEGERALFEKQYFEVTTKLYTIIDLATGPKPATDNQPNLQNQNNPQVNSANRNAPKLPEIKLPEFSGDYGKWLFFKNSFETTIHNDESIPNVQKHQYLIGVLKGEALNVIEGFTISNENYINAWNLLKATYDNQIMIIETHMEELLKFPDISKDNKVDSMRKLNWHIQTNISALKSLNQPVDYWDSLIIHLAKKKLDYAEQRDWQERNKNRTPENMPTLTDFTKFLAERCQSLMLLQQNRPKSTNLKTSYQRDRAQNKRLVLMNTSSNCILCGNGNHLPFNCEALLKLSPDNRRKLLMEKKCCVNCLKYGHFSKDCRSSKCRKCDMPHNTLLHKDGYTLSNAEKPAVSEPTPQVQNSGSTPASQRLNVALARKTKSQILLSTALVYAEDNQGKKVKCRALLDPGAQLNLITTNLRKRLKLKHTNQKLQFSGVQCVQGEAKGVDQIRISSIQNPFEVELECLVVPSITEQLPQSKVNVDEVLVPSHINLADPYFNEPGDIDLLLGAGFYWKIVVGEPKNHIDGQPALQNTQLGWILGGEVQSKGNGKATCLTVTNYQLSQQLERFWKQEAIPEIKYQTKEEQLCEKLFADTTTRDSTGRFIVRLPTRPEVVLGESKEQAKRRLEGLERKFIRQPTLKQAYCEFMDTYEQLGHMSLIEDTPPETGEAYFIPHHAVLRPDSSSTKLRVVFDASAATTNGKSLNNKLMTGPNLQAELVNIMIRFRTHKYVITADIEKMFRQITVHPEDRSLQQILWRRDAHMPIKTYQLNTVTYGTVSAPFHAMRCLRELATVYDQQYPLAAKAIRQDFYMDDCITGGETIDTVMQMQEELLQLLERGNMVLRKWRSNDKRILQNLKIQQNTHDWMIVDKVEACKTLGLVWNSQRDTLQVQVTFSPKPAITKRDVLSKISQVFDPLGVISPVLITGKIIMHRLWVDGLDWDEPLNQEQLDIWDEYYASLALLNKLTITRNVHPHNQEFRFDVYGFCDASEKAFGACIYAVSKNHDGVVTSRLISSKSAVAPNRTISLPRLELEGALLLAKLLREVMDAISHRIKNTFLWSDSTIVLGWIKTEPRLLKSYVANRVTKIQDATEHATWDHVPSKDNPADLISRGISPEEIEHKELWWSGPEWLATATPRPSFSMEPETDLPELKNLKTTLTITNTSRILHKYSSFSKLRRLIAYWHRYLGNIQSRIHVKTGKMAPKETMTGYLKPEELRQAETSIIRWTQMEALSSFRKNLIKKEKQPKGSPLKSLDAFVDEDGLIRVGGRLKYSSLTEEQKYPIILPANHHITTSIMRREHVRLHHCPPEQLLHAIRQRYWPIAGRREAQKIVRRCLNCFRFNPSIPEVRMGDLPKERVTKVTRPFTVTGVDYAGPFQLRESKRRGRLQIFKCYVAVFTCFSTKAVHLELVSDLTTEAFLAALQRFTARRGICSQMFSDNGRNFVGAANALKELNSFLTRESSDIASHLAEQHISWKFIPPRSPHFGGLWEAVVKIMKRHLYTVSQGRLFTFEELSTLLCDIEAILNSRPLTPLTSDPNDLSVLTPAHFLIGDSLVQPMQSSHIHEPDNHLSKWQHLKKVRQILWQRWQREYLQELQRRTKWNTTDQRVELGNLVLLIEEGVPPLKWSRGRVIKLHPGQDGEVRVVTVKTLEGVFTRSVKRVCLLPIDD